MNKAEEQQAVQEKPTYRDRLIEIILKEWFLYDMDDDQLGGPYNNQMYDFQKKYCSHQSPPNCYFNTLGEADYKRRSINNDVLNQIRTYRRLKTNPASFTTDEIETFRNDLMTTRNTVIQYTGWRDDYERKNDLIAKNSRELAEYEEPRAHERRLGM